MTHETWPVPLPGSYEIPDEPELAVEKFWSLWGEKAGFSREQFGNLWSDADSQYVEELAQHNFWHAQESLWDTMCLADELEDVGIIVNRKALATASLFHDAGYHDDFMRSQFSSKEEYSAAIFANLAPRYGLTPDDIEVGKQAILSTAIDGTPVSYEDKCMVLADMMNVSGDYEADFGRTTDRLLSEAQLKEQSGGIVDRLVFRSNSIRTIASYLSRDLSLGTAGSHERFTRSVANFRRLVVETASEEHLPVPEFVRRLGSSAVTKLFGDHSETD